MNVNGLLILTNVTQHKITVFLTVYENWPSYLVYQNQDNLRTKGVIYCEYVYGYLSSQINSSGPD